MLGREKGLFRKSNHNYSSFRQNSTSGDFEIAWLSGKNSGHFVLKSCTGLYLAPGYLYVILNTLPPLV